MLRRRMLRKDRPGSGVVRLSPPFSGEEKFPADGGHGVVECDCAPLASATFAAISPAGPPPIMAIFTRYLFIVTVKTTRPPYVRSRSEGAFNVGLESTT